jgi:tetratricopeptide (TPR) repeat protein
MRIPGLILTALITCQWMGAFGQSELRTQLTQGIDLIQEKEFAKGYQILLDGAQKADEADSTALSVLFNNNIGALYFYLNQTDSAMFYYHKAYQIAEEHELLKLQNSVLNNMGIVYSTKGFDDKAQEVISKALAISVLSNDSVKMAINHANLAQINFKTGNLIAAQNHAEHALSYPLDTSTLFSVENTLTQVHLSYSRLDSALAMVNQTLQLADTHKNRAWKSTSLFLQGEIYTAQERLWLAKKSFYESLQYGDSLNPLQQLEVWYALKELYQTQNQLDSALYCFDKVLELKDQITANTNEGFVSQSQLRFDLHLQQQQLLLEQQKNRQRVFVSRILLIGLIIAVTLLIIIIVQRKKVSALRQQQLNNEKLLAEQQRDEAELKTTHLEEQLASINYELMSKSLLIDNKNTVLKAVSELVNESDIANSSKYIQDLKQELNRNKLLDQNHEEFTLYFERVHADFFKNLHEQHVGLSSTDLRLAVFFLLQFNTKEIATILHITPDSVRKRKQRLREKMGLEKGTDIQSYLLKFT